MAVATGDQFGYQRKPGRSLGDEHRGFHGSWRAGIDELVPSSKSGWAQHEASHPEQVYGSTSEDVAWDQAQQAGSKRLGEVVTRADDPTKFLDELTGDPTNSMINPTVYDTTIRGNVTTDPEMDSAGRDPVAFRGNFGEVNAEIPMPRGAQGTLLPDYFGRRSSFDVGYKGMVVDEEVGVLSGARFARPNQVESKDQAVEDLDQVNARQKLLASSRNQKTQRFHDEGVEAIGRNAQFFDEAPADIKDAVRAEKRSPRIFPLSEVADRGAQFPYGKLAGWDARVAALGRSG